MTLERPPLVILGGSYNALSVARSLHQLDVEVHLLLNGRSRIGRSVASSRAVSNSGASAGSAEHLRDTWRAELERHDEGAVLMAGSDEGIEFLVNEDRWLRDLGLRPIEHGGSVNLHLLDKEKTFELATAAGVAAPRVVRVAQVGEALAAAREIGYPCGLKPVSSHQFARARAGSVNNKGAVVHSATELERSFAELSEADAPLLVTEFVPGPDSAYCSYYSFLDERGRPLVHFTKRKPRQYPVHFGLGSFHVTDWVPEAAEIGLRMFQASGVRGIANVEFKRDARDRTLKLIECNLRLTAADDLVRRAGVDLGRLAYERATGHRGQRPLELPDEADFRQGLRQWLPTRDLRAFRQYHAEGELTVAGWLRSLRGPMSTPLFSMKDPKPTVVNAAQVIRDRLGPQR